MIDQIKTIRENAQCEIVINKSRFIGQCFLVTSVEQSNEILNTVRKKYFDASHNCFAYSLSSDVVKFSDDGEPGGTAGQPILEVIKQKGLINILVVVTRYFGGIMLGAGGLVRAYTKSAALAIDTAGIDTLVWCTLLKCEIDYSLWGKVQNLLSQTKCQIQKTEFLQSVFLSIFIPYDNVAQFKHQLNELSNAKIKIDNLDGDYCIIS